MVVSDLYVNSQLPVIIRCELHVCKNLQEKRLTFLSQLKYETCLPVEGARRTNSSFSKSVTKQRS